MTTFEKVAKFGTMMIAALALVVSISSFTSIDNGNGNENSLIGRAHSEVAQCLAAAQVPGMRYEASVSVISSCFAGGFIRTVYFYQVPAQPCHQEPCPRPAVRLVASVQYGCDDDIIGSTCY